jgi:hypothetical protein
MLALRLNSLAFRENRSSSWSATSKERSGSSPDSVTRTMRSGVTAKGGSSLTKLALAMRESSPVGKRVEGMRDGVRCKDRHLMCYNYRRGEEAPYSERL